MSSDIDYNIPSCNCQQEQKPQKYSYVSILSYIFNVILILILIIVCIHFLNGKNCLQHLNETSNTSGLSMYSSNYHSVERTLELLEQNKCSKPDEIVIKVSDIDDFEGKFKDKICIPEFIVIKKCNENITSYCGDDSGKSIRNSKCLPVEERNVLKIHQIKVLRGIRSGTIIKNITYIDNYECKCQ